MVYTENFKERCKRAFPDWQRLHDALEEGDECVGQYLHDNCERGIRYDEILAASSLEELKVKALLIKEKNALYEDFENGNCLQSKADLYKLMKALFQKTVSDDTSAVSYYEFINKAQVESSAEFVALQQHLLENNASFDNIIVRICFDEIKAEKVSSIDNLISNATALSEQSKGLTEDFGKSKDEFEMD